ncbi:hypothetical protein C8Q80DRAFT_768723 [Daedaleopsis nitida]|nr:hypothetical protein C8Q80DRAFT_768723 [Daedaleopsis nitida]
MHSSSPHSRRIAILVGISYILHNARALPVYLVNTDEDLAEPSLPAASSRTFVRRTPDSQISIFDSEHVHDATSMAAPTPSPVWLTHEDIAMSSSILVSQPIHNPHSLAIDSGCPVLANSQRIPIASLTISCCTFVILVVFVVYFFVTRWRFRREYLSTTRLKTPSLVKKPSLSVLSDVKAPATQCPTLRTISEDSPPKSPLSLSPRPRSHATHPGLDAARTAPRARPSPRSSTLLAPCTRSRSSPVSCLCAVLPKPEFVLSSMRSRVRLCRRNRLRRSLAVLRVRCNSPLGKTIRSLSSVIVRARDLLFLVNTQATILCCLACATRANTVIQGMLLPRPRSPHSLRSLLIILELSETCYA